jgi:hypothetical protein
MSPSWIDSSYLAMIELFDIRLDFSLCNTLSSILKNNVIMFAYTEIYNFLYNGRHLGIQRHHSLNEFFSSYEIWLQYKMETENGT